MTDALRRVARKTGLGQLRDRVRGSGWWVASPALRLKDLDSTAQLPSNAVALTFDDGPHPEMTPKLLDVLESHSAPATFFMCGNPASRYPDVVESVVAAGHALGGHTWDHRDIRGMSETDWQSQVPRVHDLLADLSGEPTRWFRPPRGHDTSESRSRLRRAGVATVLWSASGRDWRLTEPEAIARSVLDDLQPGGIVLLHDTITEVSGSGEEALSQRDQTHTVVATDLILREIRERGLTPISLDDIPVSRQPAFDRPRLPRRS